MIKDMKFKVTVVIVDPNNLSTHKTLKMRAEFSFVENTYGNGYYFYIKGIEGTQMEQVFDLRYENFNPNNSEIAIAIWIYSYWTGDNGSFDVKSLKIEREYGKVKAEKKDVLGSNVIQ